tara:strand:+ start:2946 stop:4310 length:1365 start_codon:yes stop_codon:yes gene_type:complete
MSNNNLYEPDQDSLSPNRNLCPISTRINNNGELEIAGCTLSKLANDFGTPLYILDEETIRLSCRAYKEALRRFYPGESLPIYASKANSSLAISKIINSEKIGIDVVSEGELLTALMAGISGDKIFLHGNNKSFDELKMAFDNEVTIVIDNQNDIDLLGKIVTSGKSVRLMLRFTPGIECHTHEYIRTGHIDSKFGFDLDKLETILLQLKEYSWADLIGLHAHIGSQIFELNPHYDLTSVMTDALKLSIELGHEVTEINLGGGLGVKYTDSDDPPSIQEWVRTISEGLVQACNQRNLKLPRLICEPGRSLIAIPGVTLYTIGSTKEVPGIRKYISVDGGMSDNPRPITYQSLYSFSLAARPLASPLEKVTIAGKHCESGDVLLKDILIPEYKSGDVLVVFGTGAYNQSMSSNYNRIPKPATVLVNEGSADLVQKRERPVDLLQYDLLPERFTVVT